MHFSTGKQEASNLFSFFKSSMPFWLCQNKIAKQMILWHYLMICLHTNMCISYTHIFSKYFFSSSWWKCEFFGFFSEISKLNKFCELILSSYSYINYILMNTIFHMLSNLLFFIFFGWVGGCYLLELVIYSLLFCWIKCNWCTIYIPNGKKKLNYSTMFCLCFL